MTSPACAQHEGMFTRTVTLAWRCPVCGEARGVVTKGLSFDGSQRLVVDTWLNPCGHVDKYEAVRQEALTPTIFDRNLGHEFFLRKVANVRVSILAAAFNTLGGQS